MPSEATAAHDALVAMWSRLLAGVEGSRFEPRGDLFLTLTPSFPLPQCNGAWIVEDSEAALAAAPAVLAEVEAAGERAWVQTRSCHPRVQQGLCALGLTHAERIPGMVVRAGELRETGVSLEVAAVEDDEAPAVVAMLATAFGAPVELFERLAATCAALPESTWYVGRLDGRPVSTALGVTLDDVTGIFNVATPSEHRRRGYGAAVTERAVRDGFRAGSSFAFLQSSELGLSVYRGLGFRVVEEYTLLTAL